MNCYQQNVYKSYILNCPLIGIILRWGFLIWELISFFFSFFLLRTFCPYLGSFGVDSTFTTRSLISKWFQLKDNIKIRYGPDYERPNNWIYKTKKSILDCPSGPVAQQIEALSLYGSTCALSEDSGFKSYTSRAIDNNYGRQ